MPSSNRKDDVVVPAEIEEGVKRIDPSRLKRSRDEPVDEEPKPAPLRVSSAAIDKALDLAFAPSREMLPSVTVIDKFQGRLFPLIDLINLVWDDVLQVASYRQDKDEYKRVFKRARPVSENWLGELLHRTALWQKSQCTPCLSLAVRRSPLVSTDRPSCQPPGE